MITKQGVPRMSAPGSVLVMPTTAHPGDCVGSWNSGAEEQDQGVDGFTTWYARVEVLERGGEWAARVYRLSS